MRTESHVGGSMIDPDFFPHPLMKKRQIKALRNLYNAAYRESASSSGWRPTWKNGKRRWRFSSPYKPPGIAFDIVVVLMLAFLILLTLLT